MSPGAVPFFSSLCATCYRPSDYSIRLFALFFSPASPGSLRERSHSSHRFGLHATVYQTTPSTCSHFSFLQRRGDGIARWSRCTPALRRSSMMQSTALRLINITFSSASSAFESPPSRPLYWLPRFSATAPVCHFYLASLSVAFVPTLRLLFHRTRTQHIRWAATLHWSPDVEHCMTEIR